MDPTALFTSRGSMQYKKSNDIYCDYCHMKGHSKDQCYKLKCCDHCKSRGYVKGNCYQLIGYPTSFKGKRKENIVTGD